ncbi:MAG: hypothetical protein A3G34_09120 [Candidatus Lindowbacteria bacterium RIFCSPLOWO2_12_FULL_62_27]|nr:MAG: hypothetical protein A3I06_03680 [Candidatus Lindowbacteria bacterium RIFCSPLOWO2_02_FULL_62_12]OGH60149.1 MAG: hypothetical protein A3G34_09120 [Candidatus Lindowbacteria bacterium RIFCSPLOWO2_12_FULL_62_27]
MKIFVSSLLVCLCLTGCGRSPSVSDDAVTLTVWETYNTEEHNVFVKLTEDFVPIAEKEFGVKVRLNIQRVPFDGFLSKLKTAALTHTTPDIARVDIGDMPTLAYGKALLALDKADGFEGPDLETFKNKFVQAAIGSNLLTIGNVTHLYGIPDQTTCVALYWNREVFRKKAQKLAAAGLNPLEPPKTWDDFIRYGRALTDTAQQEYGFGMDNSLWWTMPFYNTYAAPIIELVRGVWKYRLAEDSGVAALQLKVDLYEKHQLEAGAWKPGAIGADQGFMNGKYAMILSGPWRLETFRQSGVDYGVALIPAGPAGTSTNVGGTNMVIFRKTKHPKLALAFLNYVSSNDHQIRWSKTLNQIPVRLEAIRRVSPEAHPYLRTFMEQMQTARPRPNIPNYFMLETIVNAEMELALKGAKPVPAALRDAGKLVERKILAQLNVLRPS